MKDLEWRYRIPPIDPWWRVIVDAVAPIGEVAVLMLGVGVIWWLAILLAAL